MSTNELPKISEVVALERLFNKGVFYSTVIDVGCADGQFFLHHMKLFPNAVPLNVDANPLYEKSLEAIKDAVGGEYFIGAVTDCEGEIEFTESVHPYWSSVRAEGDAYWSRINNLIKTKAKVQSTTLDTLVGKLGLKPPFLLKLDIQGAERSALIGARSIIKNTHVVVCEADVDDFQAINAVLVDAGFQLYDLTNMGRLGDGTLGWFYPVYVNNNLRGQVLPNAFWDAKENDTHVSFQIARREGILSANAALLNRLRYRHLQLGRNEFCPCGSGRKFKHCCGSYTA
jgi:FkbM family methyltransferase